MRLQLTTIALIVSSSLLTAQTSSAGQVVDAGDTNSAQANCKPGLDCLLKVGTFSSEKYANRYKDHVSQKTKHKVKVERDPNDKNIFNVLVGPFNDAAQLIRSAADISGKPVTSAAKKTAKTTATTAKRTTTAVTKTATKPFVWTKTKKVKRTVAPAGTTKSRTKHQQILASQADYPVNQKPRTDAKGNVIPIFKAGPYIGGSVGVQSNIGLVPATQGYQAFSGTLSAGAAHMFTQRLYLGGEFFISDNIKGKSYSPGTDGFNVVSKFNFGGDFIPGYMITDHVLIYGRVGVIRNTFRSHPASHAASYINFSPYARRHIATINGWQIGAGAQTNLYKNLDGRVDYIYSQFKGPHAHVNFRSNMNQVNLGLVYKFVDTLKPAK